MHKKHLLIMLACCLLPIAGIVVVAGFNVPLGTVGTFAFLLICPLGHLLMMRSMGHKEHHQNTSSVSDNPAVEDVSKR